MGDDHSGGKRLSQPDQQLVAAILDGDEAAFMQLVERLHSPLMRLALSLLRDRAAAEDVVQETWIAVLEGLSRFEGRAALKTWISRILVNRARTRWGRDKRYLRSESLDEPQPAVERERFDASGGWRLPPELWNRQTPERMALSAEVRELIQATLEQMPPMQAAVVTLRDIEGFASQDVCNALEISETNQRVLLHRGRSRLRQALEQLQAGRGAS